MVYKGVRGWTSGRGLPVQNFVETLLRNKSEKKLDRSIQTVHPQFEAKTQASNRTLNLAL